ncbi:MAG TPA: hypothetical protein DDW49_05555 [Deltaproteobacteria bacterium]|nr:MAG: hypothetical protein A2048_06270 [Deltaproteobacteria bacterium GWA2_45_12]HBF12841.1 hypothetical protein [Deltaproteobacteria bacterium]
MNDKQKQFLEGVRLFNEGKFYESHEVWEEIWLKEKERDRGFYQGLIVAAGGLHHFQKGRLSPSSKALYKSLDKLKVYPPIYQGIHLARFIHDMGEFISHMAPPFPKLVPP